MSQNMINTAKLVRTMTLRKVESIPEELFDIQPEPFQNTIRWQIGHIVYCLDHLLSLGFPFDSDLPESYASLFGSGTKPADWNKTPPAKEELVYYLSRQLDSLDIALDKLEEPLQAPLEMGPYRLETIGELFNFVFVHEAMHQGMTTSLLKCVQANSSKS